ncbi:RrF2 family transcriptional regulator [Paracoccus aerodenitrificans]|uniref:RrF2 family transcriptional regulator n=1 Tax=Paracoccus aerodenitrificans TaxID=3017781 RepID=UPI0022F0CEAE|nr:Rrf2 family transcriptional regulator [Paracoccus aerodenitrificans]WBU64531.1 Rrf2 family transcriptional regulator [Paracoccus aerodenitrificans]
MRLTVRTDLAMRILMYCAVNGDRLTRSGEVAAVCNASAHHIAQVVNQLASEGYLRTHRGRSGGVELARSPDAITVGEIFAHFEAELPLTECFDSEGNTCPLSDGCRLRGALINAVAAFYGELEEITLAELVAENMDLETAFSAGGCGAFRRGQSGPAIPANI